MTTKLTRTKQDEAGRVIENLFSKTHLDKTFEKYYFMYDGEEDLSEYDFFETNGEVVYWQSGDLFGLFFDIVQKIESKKLSIKLYKCFLNIYACVLYCMTDKIRENINFLQKDYAFVLELNFAINFETKRIFLTKVKPKFTDQKEIDRVNSSSVYYHASNKKIKPDGSVITKKDRLLFRKFTLMTKDVDDYYDFWTSQPVFHRKLWDIGVSMTKEEVAILLAQNYDRTVQTFGLYHTDGQLIGIAGLKFRTDQYAKNFKNNYFTSVIIDHDFLGQGFGFDAMKLLLDYIKENKKIYDINKVYASIYKDNQVSISLHQKLNFKLIGDLSSTVLIFVKHL